MIWDVKNTRRVSRFTVKIPFGKVSSNGIIYNSEALLEAIKSCNGLGEITHKSSDGLWFGV